MRVPPSRREERTFMLFGIAVMAFLIYSWAVG